ncbi:MAG: CBS domain-containing protein, partial [Vicinamibacterales bacterium]
DVLAGIITDGDLRRRMESTSDILALTAVDVMTLDPISVPPSMLAAEALHVLEQRKITALAVVEGEPRRVVGVVHLHDLWRTELV